MRISIFQIKLVHTIIFFVLSACVLYSLYSAVSGRITAWTWAAVGLIVIEGIVLAFSGWVCPLTILAERIGALRGSVSDIFLPKWFADRIFPLCGTLFLTAVVILLVRLLVLRS